MREEQRGAEEPGELQGGHAARPGRRALRRLLVLLASSLLLLSLALVLVYMEPGLRSEEVARAYTPDTTSPPELPQEAEEPEPAPELEPDPELTGLEPEFQRIADSYAGEYGVVLHEPLSGESVEVNADGEFFAASIGKLPAMLTLYRAAARGEIGLDDEITMSQEDIRPFGTGVLYYTYPVGHKMSARECAWHLMKESDNTAWAMLDRHLGKERIAEDLQDLGVRNAAYGGLSRGLTTSPADVTLMLQSMVDPEYTSEAYSQDMLDAMTDTAYEDRLPALLPPEARVAHKIGSYEDTVSDAGVVYYTDGSGTEQHYFITVMARETEEHIARDAIGEMSLAAYRAIAEDSPPEFG